MNMYTTSWWWLLLGGGGGVDTRHFVQTETFHMDTIFEWMDSAVWWSKMDSWWIHPVKGKAFAGRVRFSTRYFWLTREFRFSFTCIFPFSIQPTAKGFTLRSWMAWPWYHCFFDICGYITKEVSNNGLWSLIEVNLGRYPSKLGSRYPVNDVSPIFGI